MLRATEWAKAPPLAAEGDQLVVRAVGTAQPKEAVGQDAALEESAWNSSFTNCGRPALEAASASAKKVAACSSRGYSVVRSGR
jgi:hypothetical protein